MRRTHLQVEALTTRPAANDACWDSNLVFAMYGIATVVLGGIALVLMVA